MRGVKKLAVWDNEKGEFKISMCELYTSMKRGIRKGKYEHNKYKN